MTKSTRLFFTALGAVAVMQLGKLFFPSPYLRQFHLNSNSFFEWSLLQTVPSMYNYSNRIWVSYDPYNEMTIKEIAALELEHEGMQMNHYPVRVFTFRQDRDKVFGPAIRSVYVRSIYGGKLRISAYEVEVIDNKAEIILKEVYVK